MDSLSKECQKYARELLRAREILPKGGLSGMQYLRYGFGGGTPFDEEYREAERILRDVCEKMLKRVKGKFSDRYVYDRLRHIVKTSSEAGLSEDDIRQRLLAIYEDHASWDTETRILFPVQGVAVPDGFYDFGPLKFWASESLDQHIEAKRQDNSKEDLDREYLGKPVIKRHDVWCECARVAERVKAKELCEITIRTALDILQYGQHARLRWPDVPPVDLCGRGHTGGRHVFELQEGGLPSGWVDDMTNAEEFVLSKEKESEWKDLRLLQLVSLLDKRNASKLEKGILRAIHWFAHGEREKQEEAALVVFVISLESLLGRQGPGVSVQTSTAEAVAFLLGETLEERLEIYKLMRKYYGLRSRIAHSGGVDVARSNVTTVRLFAGEAIAEMMSLSEQEGFTSKGQFREWVERQKFSSKAEADE